jgi:hypothetical protein
MEPQTPPLLAPTPGDIVGAPPYRATGCLMQGLFLKGDRDAQQRFCDTVLNGPAAGALTFRAVTDQVLVTALYVDTMSSLDPVDSRKGVTQEWDVAFWSAVHGGASGAPDAWRTYWLPSFMFVDSTWAMAAGREIYGYPKTTAAFQDRRADNADPTVTLVAAHFPVFAPDQRPVTEALVRIDTGGPGVHAPDLASEVGDAWRLFEALAPLQDGVHLPPWPHVSMPQILLRQARDPAAFGRASLQSILCVSPTALRVTGGGLLHSPTRVTITPSASHPIMQTLGLAVSQVGELGFWLTQDFEVGPAQILAG